MDVIPSNEWHTNMEAISFPVILHAAESEISPDSLTHTVVLIPVDSEGRPMQELVVRGILQELDKARRKKDWSMPYHR
jgi:hypothetical protein